MPANDQQDNGAAAVVEAYEEHAPLKYFDLDGDYASTVTGLAKLAYEAMAPIMSRAGREQVCAEEGHRPVETTQLGSVDYQFQCVRCGHAWTEPREHMGQ